MQLKISQLQKTYRGGVRAIADLNLEIGSGLFGLLGPNGSGKSTLMRIIATLLEADAGQVMLGEIDLLQSPQRARPHIGYLPQAFGAYPNMSAFEMLDYLATMRGIGPKSVRRHRVEECLAKVNLFDVRHRRAEQFSGGMIRRLGIAQATLDNPKLLLVDEPTAGLDPIERQSLYQYLVKTAKDTTVILATHLVDDVRSLCSDMAILGAGSILVHGHPEEVISSVQGRIWSQSTQPDKRAEIEKTWPIVDTRWEQQHLFVDVLCNERPGPSFEEKPVRLQDAYFAYSKHAPLLNAESACVPR